MGSGLMKPLRRRRRPSNPKPSSKKSSAGIEKHASGDSGSVVASTDASAIGKHETIGDTPANVSDVIPAQQMIPDKKNFEVSPQSATNNEAYLVSSDEEPTIRQTSVLKFKSGSETSIKSDKTKSKSNKPTEANNLSCYSVLPEITPSKTSQRSETCVINTSTPPVLSTRSPIPPIGSTPRPESSTNPQACTPAPSDPVKIDTAHSPVPPPMGNRPKSVSTRSSTARPHSYKHLLPPPSGFLNTEVTDSVPEDPPSVNSGGTSEMDDVDVSRDARTPSPEFDELDEVKLVNPMEVKGVESFQEFGVASVPCLPKDCTHAGSGDMELGSPKTQSEADLKKDESENIKLDAPKENLLNVSESTLLQEQQAPNMCNSSQHSLPKTGFYEVQPVRNVRDLLSISSSKTKKESDDENLGAVSSDSPPNTVPSATKCQSKTSVRSNKPSTSSSDMSSEDLLCCRKAYSQNAENEDTNQNEQNLSSPREIQTEEMEPKCFDTDNPQNKYMIPSPPKPLDGKPIFGEGNPVRKLPPIERSPGMMHDLLTFSSPLLGDIQPSSSKQGQSQSIPNSARDAHDITARKSKELCETGEKTPTEDELQQVGCQKVGDHKIVTSPSYEVTSDHDYPVKNAKCGGQAFDVSNQNLVVERNSEAVKTNVEADTPQKTVDAIPSSVSMSTKAGSEHDEPSLECSNPTANKQCTIKSCDEMVGQRESGGACATNDPGTSREPSEAEGQQRPVVEMVDPDLVDCIQKQLFEEGLKPAMRDGGVSFFVPITEDGLQPAAQTSDISGRLTKGKNRPSLNYEEKMMLANLNRQAHLSKRKEFAVRDIQNVRQSCGSVMASGSESSFTTAPRSERDEQEFSDDI